MARGHALWWQRLSGLAAGVLLILILPARAGQGETLHAQPQAAASGLPRIGHSDTLLNFQALRFAPIPAVQYTAIVNDYDAGILHWDVQSTRSWLSANPVGAVANSTEVAIWIVNTDAELGRHTGHLVIQSDNAVNSPDTIFVQLDMLCPVQVLGDANWDGRTSQADIIYLVNNVLRGGPMPKPVWQAGDMNCDETLSQSDIISLVFHLLRGGPAPCNVCQFF